MNNDFIEKYKDDEKVKRILDELKATEKEYVEKEKQAKKEEKAKYNAWYKGLSDLEKAKEDLRVLNEQSKETNNKIRRMKRLKEKSDSQKERDARTHRLVQAGAIVENVLGRPFVESDYPKLKKFLESQENRGHWFTKAMNEPTDNDPISSETSGDLYD